MSFAPKLRTTLLVCASAIVLAGALAACGDSSQQADTSNLAKISAPTPLPASAAAPTVTSAASAAPTAAATIAAQATTAPATAVAQITLAPLKKGVVLEPMAWEAQTWNNCAPVSAEMALSFYGVKTTQKDAASILKPNDGDKHVEPTQIVDFVESMGYRTMIRDNGNFDILKAFLSAGIPVITQQWLHQNDDIAHYRVARGYDSAKNIFIFNDSMDRHPNTEVSVALQEELWKGFDHRFLPIYSPQQEPIVRAILGADYDATSNLSRATAAAKTYAQTNPADIDAWRNLGFLYHKAGDYPAAIGVWEQHLSKMLKATDKGPYNRFLWYQLWPIESYNKVGNFQKTLEIMPNELSQIKVFAEGRYEYALALMNTGKRDEAIAQLKQATQDDIHFAAARDMLAKLGIS